MRCYQDLKRDLLIYLEPRSNGRVRARICERLACGGRVLATAWGDTYAQAHTAANRMIYEQCLGEIKEVK